MMVDLYLALFQNK
ncbi:hypothetical protein LINPERPRIM_LOCUS22625 [Linum perenne]